MLLCLPVKVIYNFLVSFNFRVRSIFTWAQVQSSPYLHHSACHWCLLYMNIVIGCQNKAKVMLFLLGFVKLLTWIYQSLLIFPPDLLIARGLSSPRSPPGLAWLPLLIANSRHTPPVSTYDYNISPPAIFIVCGYLPLTTTSPAISLVCISPPTTTYFSTCNIYCV